MNLEQYYEATELRTKIESFEGNINQLEHYREMLLDSGVLDLSIIFKNSNDASIDHILHFHAKDKPFFINMITEMVSSRQSVLNELEEEFNAL